MKCPNCGNDFTSKTFHKVKIEECEKCQGLWFDRDELNNAKNSTDSDLAWINFDIFEEKGSKYEKNQGNKLCPKDSSSLQKFTYSHSKVSIDACPTCHGIFLDKNEFDKIISYLEKEVVSNTSGDWVKEALNEFNEILNGEEIKASELRDLLTVIKLGETRLSAEHEKITAILTFFPIR